MQDSDRFNWRRPQDYGWLMLGIVYFMLLPFVWILQAMAHVDTTARTSRRRTAHRNTRKTSRFKMPKPRVIKTPKFKTVKPTISVSRRWVKSLGRYQTTYYNRETRRRTTYPKVSEMVPKK